MNQQSPGGASQRDEEIRRALQTNGEAGNPAPSPAEGQKAIQSLAAAQAYRRAAANFYSIAGFSLINSVVSVFQGGWYFLIGLGITQIVDALAYLLGGETPELKTAATVFAFVIDLAICGAVALFGYFASKGWAWSIVLGMAAYSVDALILLFIQDWLGFAFHLYFLWRIWMSWRIIRLWRKSTGPAGDPFPANIGIS